MVVKKYLGMTTKIFVVKVNPLLEQVLMKELKLYQKIDFYNTFVDYLYIIFK